MNDDNLTRREMLALMLAGGTELCAGKLWAASCGAPPEAKKQHWKAAESFPPLPLPVTPLRRSEKKRPPAPPLLIGKLQYGKTLTGTDANGQRYSYRDWTTDPNDANALMNQANATLGINYRAQEADFASFSFEPQEMPILYLTGHEGFAFTDAERSRLRSFIEDGGFLLGDACCGAPEYRLAFLDEAKKLFPARRCRRLPPDHPVYTAYHTLEAIHYEEAGKGAFTAPPALEGISIGCREAVLVSQYDLSCGWDGHRHDSGKRVWPAADAMRIGVNLIAYTLATYRLGLYLATRNVYNDANASGGLVIGQIVHDGDWNPNPSGLANLCKHSLTRSSLAVKFAKKDLSLKSGDLQACPVLYMTGHDDFTLTDDEAANLRAYLARGGALLADACCGRQDFDRAFRREIAKVLPDQPLKPLPPDHPMFRMIVDSSAVTAAPALTAKRRDKPLTAPDFWGVAGAGGTLSVVYTPWGLGCGWEDEQCPYCLGYSRESARDLGMNVLAYFMTH
ncbi:MAG: DUF4159 domain-containing protein [Planctomycetes bacterium]|nr:DUF4159 domain-containing protein [Planctomycetota bacterium]